MKLYTFEVSTAVGRFRRIGAGLGEKIVDLNLACTAYLAATGEPDPYIYASFLIPTDMVTYFERGDRSRKAADQALLFVRDRLKATGTVEGPDKERIIYEPGSVRLLAPVSQAQRAARLHGIPGAREGHVRERSRGLFQVPVLSHTKRRHSGRTARSDIHAPVHTKA